MWTNHLKLAFRILWKNKTYSLLNVIGLSVGLACCLLIGLYIQRELSFDRYHEKHERIYRLAMQIEGASYENGIAKISGPWAAEVERAIPEVEQACRFVFFGQALFDHGNLQAYESGGMFADTAALTMFSWPLLEGDRLTALSEPNTVVLTQSLADKYFSDRSAMGESLRIDGEEYRVTGIVSDVPENSHFTYNFLVSMATYQHPDMNDWVRWNQFYTYLLFRPEASAEVVAGKIDAIGDQHLPADNAAAATPLLQPLADIHLQSKLHREMAANSDIRYVYIFGAIALFILVIASFNFINLSTARAFHRAREVVMRKVTGATRSALIRQYLGESFLLVSIAAVLAVVLASLMLPALNIFLEQELAFNWTQNWVLTGGLLALIAVVGLLSGSYPAFVLAGFRPSTILKGSARYSGSPRLRQVMVVAQFTIAVFLISGALIISGQLDYIRSKNLGFNKEQILVIPLPDQNTRERGNIIKEELEQLPGVLSASLSANRPGGGDFGVPYQAVGLPDEQQPAMRCLVIDAEFLDTYQMEIIDGRGFQADMPTDTAAYLINETAARQLGWEEPVGQQLAMPAINRAPGPIVGVVRDFHFRSLHEAISPLYFFWQPAWFSQLSVRLDAEQIEPALAQIEQRWEAFAPQLPFGYSFFDEAYDNLHQSEERTATIIRWFTIIAVLVTCLGLFGLSTYTAERRTKEIGIRKVLGASVGSLVGMLSKDFIKLVLIGFILALPLAWLAARKWLSAYAYHIDISWWYFALAGLIAVAIALLTVSFQSIRAALSNPVETLKVE